MAARIWYVSPTIPDPGDRREDDLAGRPESIVQVVLIGHDPSQF